MKSPHIRAGRGRLCAALALFVGSQASAQPMLPRPEQPFRGTIGLRTADSVKDFPQMVEAPEGAPNVLLILTDDVGFGASSTFGGPIPTPTFDRLAAEGVRYNRFHTTALCSPTRAALITGRNHHTCATGVIMELGTGYPGYNSVMPRSCGTIAEVLRQNGYNTSWFGKNHNVPDWQSSMAGPFDLWPTGLGFEKFYGFIGGDANQWDPAIVDGTNPAERPMNDPNYHFDVDMADNAVRWLQSQNAMAPDKPFFLYYAPGTAHAPHHAPQEWIARFKGQFDMGWDRMRELTLARQIRQGVVPAGTRLAPMPPGIPAWDSLDADHKRLYSRMMEIYAASLAHCDDQIGRLIAEIERSGELDNTLIIYIQGDNGASAEGSAQGLLNEMTVFNNLPEDFSEVLRRMDQLGGPMTFNHYPIGWAAAMCTPFPWTKQVASHFGGTRNGMVIRWPGHVEGAGGVRSQFHHVIDITPTILEAVGVEMPAVLNGVAQTPVEGVSMMYSFADAAAPDRHTVQYFEMFGNRAIYQNGWVAATTPTSAPWVAVPGDFDAITGYEWELYNVDEDFSQAANVAAANPERLADMQTLFYAEAARHNVLPIDNSKVQRFDVSLRPSLTRGRDTFTYFPGMVRIPEGTAPDTKNRSYSLTADIVIPQGGASGALGVMGGRFGGWAFFLLDGKPVFNYNLAGIQRFEVAGPAALTPGAHTVAMDFTYDGGGIGRGGVARILVDGREVAQGRAERTLAFRLAGDETLDIGEDHGTPGSEAYAGQMPFRFTGTLNSLTIELK